MKYRSILHGHVCVMFSKSWTTTFSSSCSLLFYYFSYPAGLKHKHIKLDPLVTNGFSHPYHLDGSTFISRVVRSNFSFLFHCSTKIKIANRKAPTGTPRFAASHLGQICLPVSNKKDARLIWVKDVVVLRFYVSPTAKIIRRRDLDLKSHPKDLRSPRSNSRPLD